MVDYRGQKLGETIFYIITISFGVVAWIVGFVQKDFFLAVKGWSVGLGLALLLCIPDWPFFNRHPVKWLDEVGQYKSSEFKADGSDEAEKSKKPDKKKPSKEAKKQK